jgi:hypothetical protein
LKDSRTVDKNIDNHEKECITSNEHFYTKIPTLSNETQRHFIPPLYPLIIEGLSYFEGTSPSTRGTKSGGPEPGPVGTTEEVDEATLL